MHFSMVLLISLFFSPHLALSPLELAQPRSFEMIVSLPALVPHKNLREMNNPNPKSCSSWVNGASALFHPWGESSGSIGRKNSS